MKEKKFHLLTVQIPLVFMGEITELCDKHGYSISSLTRLALTDYCQRIRERDELMGRMAEQL